jgi:GMP synthase-like glutamine amidotransferase
MILIIKHTFSEGPGILEDIFRARKIQTKIIEFENGDKLPSKLGGIDAVVSLGGPMNVYQEQEYPFLKREDDFLKKAFDKSVPVLGICLGAQLMAKALGAKVTKAAKTEIGWYDLMLNDKALADPLFKGIDKTLTVFQWHGDKFELPQNADLFCENTVCPQLFRFGNNSYGFQFHFEVTPEMIADWTAVQNTPAMDASERAHISSQTRALYGRFLPQAEKIISNFISKLEI